MPSSEKPLVYLVLGAAGSGRREVLADLIAGGMADGERAAVLLSAAEAPDEFDARLPGLNRWTWHDTHIAATLPAGVARVFFVTDGRASPVDQIEAFKPWLAAQGGALARVLCIVHCRLAEQHPLLLAWF